MAMRINCTCQRENRRPFSVTVSKYMPNISKYHESIYLSIDLSIYLSICLSIYLSNYPIYSPNMEFLCMSGFFTALNVESLEFVAYAKHIWTLPAGWYRGPVTISLLGERPHLLCTPFSININMHLPKLFRSISTCCTWYMPSRLSCKNMHISSHLRNIAGSATRFVAHSLVCSLALSLSLSPSSD